MDKCLILQIFREFFFQSRFINEHSHQQYTITLSLYEILKMLIMWRNVWLLPSGPLTLGRSEKWQLNFYRIFFSVLQNVQELHRCNIVGWLLEMPLNYTSGKNGWENLLLMTMKKNKQCRHVIFIAPFPDGSWPMLLSKTITTESHDLSLTQHSWECMLYYLTYDIIWECWHKILNSHPKWYKRPLILQSSKSAYS